MSVEGCNSSLDFYFKVTGSGKIDNNRYEGIMLNKSSIFFFLLLSYCTANAQQVWQPTFQQPLQGSTSITGKLSLGDYLRKDVTYEKNNTCKGEFALFYFLVGSNGGIDSLYIEGNLNEKSKDIIKGNILSTENNWALPKNTKSTDKCWFVYPYFDVGTQKLCSEETRNYSSQLTRLILLYSMSKGTVDVHGRIIIPPAVMMISER